MQKYLNSRVKKSGYIQGVQTLKNKHVRHWNKKKSIQTNTGNDGDTATDYDEGT